MTTHMTHSIFRILKQIVFLACAMAIAVCTFTACGGNGQNNGTAGSGEKTTIKGYVRTVSFLPVSEKIYFDGEEAGESNPDGTFEISVAQGDENTYAEKLALEGNSFVAVQYGQNGAEYFVIKADEGVTQNDFYMLSGKVVKHFAEGDELVGGETVASGTVLKIDGNPVLTFVDDRNFGIGPVYKNSVISLENGDKTFITASEIPFNNVTYAKILEITGIMPEVRETNFNGNLFQISSLEGVTFRLKNDPNSNI